MNRPAYQDIRDALAAEFTEWLADIEIRTGDVSAARTTSPQVEAMLQA